MERYGFIAASAKEAVIDLAKDGVIYAEVRVAPEHFTKQGMVLEQVVEAMLEGYRLGEVETGLQVKTILCGMRQLNMSQTVAELVVKYRDKGVVAFDIAGPEKGFPPILQQETFDYLKRNEIPFTIHAGEADGPESIDLAMNSCGATRIGHGVRIVDDLPDGRIAKQVLEQQILKLNYKTFTQVVILGSASFVPFMQLSSAQRREVIEDILDIRIFSTMNQLLKEKVNDTKAEIVRIETEIANAKTKVEAQNSIIKTISDAKADNIRSIQEKIATSTQEISTTQSEIDVLVGEITTLKDQTKSQDKINEDLQKANQLQQRLLQKVETCEHNMEFFGEHDVCPSCNQDISDQYKESILKDLNQKLSDQNSKVDELNSVLTKLQEKLSAINEVIQRIADKNIELSTKNSSITLLNRQISEAEVEIERIKSDTTNINEEKNKLKELAQDALAKIKLKTELQEHRNIEEVASILLKDTGIKTAIIREYLPVMNKLINKYLNAMDAYIQFELDEAFNETVKSRFRDDFTYASFSEGEKMRIDLAILFTWRQIAKMKNSVNTNLLLLDEIFDSSLDTAGTDYFLNLMNQFGENSNIFVISHKGDQLFDKFRSVIKFEKRNDFSVIVGS